MCVLLADENRFQFENGQTFAVPSSYVVNDGVAMRLMIESWMGIGISSS